MREQLVVIGSGGHARSVIDSALDCGRFEVMGVLSPSSSDWIVYRGVEWIGSDFDRERIYASGCCAAALGIGFMGEASSVREALQETYASTGFFFPPIVDPSAIVSKGAILEEGAFVGKGAIVNANAHVGRFSIINSAALVEHDCRVGEYSHVAVAATLCGGVRLGVRVLVGANATIIQGIDICDNVIVGAGSLVLRDVSSSGRVLGIFNGKE